MALLTGTRWAQPPCAGGWGSRLGQFQGPAATAVAAVPLANLSPTPVSQPFLPPSLTHPPTHPSACPSACLSILTSVHSSLPPCPPFPFSLLYIHLSTDLSIHLSIHPPILPSISPPTHPSIHLSIHLPILPSISPSTCPFFHLSIHLPIHASRLSAHLSTLHKPVHLSLSSYSSICHLPARLSPVVKIFCPPTLLLYAVWLPVVVHHLPVCPSALPSTCLAVLLTDHLPCFIPHLSDQSLGTHPSVHLLAHPLCSVSALRKSHQGLPCCSRVMPQPIMWPQKPPAPSPSPAC